MSSIKQKKKNTKPKFLESLSKLTSRRKKSESSAGYETLVTHRTFDDDMGLWNVSLCRWLSGFPKIRRHYDHSKFRNPSSNDMNPPQWRYSF